MAKEKAPKERLLRKLIPPCIVDVSGSNYTVAGGGGWKLLQTTSATGSPNFWAIWRGYFDLSGIVEQQETLFTVGPIFQEATDWDFVTSNSIGAIQTWDMITQEYLIDSTFDGALGGSGMWIPPGMMSTSDPGLGPNTGAPYDLQDVHYGNARTFQYGPVTSLGVSPFHPLMSRTTAWGTGSATAGEKLYITRAIYISGALAAEPLNELNSPPTAVVIPCLILKEPDLHYIERLRRSYVVQPTVD